MKVYLLLFLLVTSICILIPGRRTSVVFAWLIMIMNLISSTLLSLMTLIPEISKDYVILSPDKIFIFQYITCDKLSSFFILIINFTVLTGFIYARGYLRSYVGTKPAAWVKLHYFALVLLHASMLLVTLFRSGLAFLIVWEMMTLSSFLLVIFDYDVKGTIRIGINYLIQMHVGMLLILSGLIMSSRGCDSISFDNLINWFAGNPNWPVFLLFFIGFGMKAGFFLLHTWLPDAHPAAPSHVSGIMSGVMIKLGIYGILRVTMYLQNDLHAIGASVLILSAITGLFGVMMAILQHDIKKLLAYHSVENIGIIGMGIGLGIYGNATGNFIIATAGFAGALLHTLNHSLFKSLLFYSAGSVVQQVHTRNIERMGGIIKYMPLTAMAFLIGAMAISGLPPFNGFVSEFLLYSSLFKGFSTMSFLTIILFFISIISLVLIGGLALLCFTKIFGIVFLGQARSKFEYRPAETSKSMLIPQFLAIIPIVLIGVIPVTFIHPTLSVVNSFVLSGNSLMLQDLIDPLKSISLSALILLLIAGILLIIRYLAFSSKIVTTGPTWGCGYTAIDERQQYTATSFVQEYSDLVDPVIKTGVTQIKYPGEEIFPGNRTFHTHSEDKIRQHVVMRPATFMINLLRRAAIFQTGKLQHYVLYVLLFLILIIMLTFLKLI
jgi:hydrogenase-4 component B